MVVSLHATLVNHELLLLIGFVAPQIITLAVDLIQVRIEVVCIHVSSFVIIQGQLVYIELLVLVCDIHIGLIIINAGLPTCHIMTDIDNLLLLISDGVPALLAQEYLPEDTDLLISIPHLVIGRELMDVCIASVRGVRLRLVGSTAVHHLPQVHNVLVQNPLLV